MTQLIPQGQPGEHTLPDDLNQSHAGAAIAAKPVGGGVARRGFLQRTGTGAAALLLAGVTGKVLAAAPTPGDPNRVKLSLIQDPQTEQAESTPDPAAAPDQRVGYAIVGLGRLSLNQILPAMSQCKYSKVVALVSGDSDKARKVGRQYGVREDAIYDYHTYERMADNREVQVMYVVLPNGMHAEYTVRAAAIGKHVLCEKPMAVSSVECQRMIDACRKAQRFLMIAYRSQYEAMDRMIARRVKEKQLGPLREFIAGNSQNVGDPAQWRLNLALAGGGPLPDVGIYCLNAARFLSGEEPHEVIASVFRPADDPRFREVEQSVHFVLRFPSGWSATCMASYASHESRFFRLQGAQGWAEMNPAFGYNGLQMRKGTLVEGKNATIDITIDPENQFAREIDHMSLCVARNQTPHTPGEEGLQDQRIVEAIYESARSGRAVRIAQPPGPTRGPDPDEETF
ncbi:Gfo/Idh/MocA family oxidoreductase (plasmid) [Paraburkholderia sp. D15]|uniref:Gfo/Idh/MocA family protein n=1 Tax=Paraburkholderia sp. D15 TaxID=2880218 RepID=UPI00247864F1|nr:Gfo/Idh/MocA family oxidoreductase [Paraburkholderia sp. D15]WGS55184.1 Gfo/Idh/MocA family oxidoreductase [Paraburkholderia sp. D15]